MPGPVHAPLAVSPWSPTELPPRSSTQPRVTVFPPPTKTRNRVKFVSRHRLLRPIIYLPPLELHANETLRYFLTKLFSSRILYFFLSPFVPSFCDGSINWFRGVEGRSEYNEVKGKNDRRGGKHVIGGWFLGRWLALNVSFPPSFSLEEQKIGRPKYSGPRRCRRYESRKRDKIAGAWGACLLWIARNVSRWGGHSRKNAAEPERRQKVLETRIVRHPCRRTREGWRKKRKEKEKRKRASEFRRLSFALLEGSMKKKIGFAFLGW